MFEEGTPLQSSPTPLQYTITAKPFFLQDLLLAHIISHQLMNVFPSKKCLNVQLNHMWNLCENGHLYYFSFQCVCFLTSIKNIYYEFLHHQTSVLLSKIKQSCLTEVMSMR